MRPFLEISLIGFKITLQPSDSFEDEKGVTDLQKAVQEYKSDTMETEDWEDVKKDLDL